MLVFNIGMVWIFMLAMTILSRYRENYITQFELDILL